MGLRISPDVSRAIGRLVSALILFFVKLVFATAMVLTDLWLTYLASFAIAPGSKSEIILKMVLNILFLGTAVIIAGAGALIVAVEVMRSTKSFLKDDQSDA